MRKILSTIYLTFIILSTYAGTSTNFGGLDSVADINCDTTVFYGVVGADVHRLQKVGTIILDIGVIAPSSFGSMYGLGFAGDFMNGSMNRTFYATHLGSNEVAKYTGNSWVSVANDSNLYHNVAGYGNFLYLQHVATSSVIIDQFISRLNSNGTITKIFTDTTLRFTVSDLEVDSAGNIYFFRGPAIGNTTELTVINSAGAIINSYTATASFSNVSTIFGMVFLGKQLYVGQGTTNGQLFPVIISGSTVSLGTPFDLPNNISYKDLDGCHEQVPFTSGLSTLNDDLEWSIYPNPTASAITININIPVEAAIYNVTGSLVRTLNLKTFENVIDLSDLDSGLYILKAGTRYSRIIRY
ncbi:MAG: T9SS type A sorting domain-containing protein [Bacteroidia bacterium]|nr:T9SS type A sorting domain-containing protein [Bacteroidia bacterium]